MAFLVHRLSSVAPLTMANRWCLRVQEKEKSDQQHAKSVQNELERQRMDLKQNAITAFTKCLRQHTEVLATRVAVSLCILQVQHAQI